MDRLTIGGLIKTTLIDYPGEVATVLFTYGCNLNCPFCHNRDLILPSAPRLKSADVRAHLEKRSGLCDAVVLSGGEPTIQIGLENAIQEIRGLGYKIKLDTNGTRPEVLRKLIHCGLIDYVAMDVKSSASRHDAVTGGNASDREAIEESIDLLMAAGIDYEFRTTVVMPLHDFEEIKAIGKRLCGSKRWALQAFRPSPEVPVEGGLSAPPRGTLEVWKHLLEKDLAMDQIELRTGY